MTKLNPPDISAHAQPSSSERHKPWEREVLETLLSANLKERRREWYWKIFFRVMWLVLVIAFIGGAIFHLNVSGPATNGRHTALVKLDGEISSEGLASAENINYALQSAFNDENSVAVVLRINSPGGSPVQSGIIYDEIHRLRKQYPNKPLYAVVDEICASGGYYVASAADNIYVNQASLVGSIGVLIDSFGFVGLMNKLGVERRLYTAGENKAMLDPFVPQTGPHRAYTQHMLDEVHAQFIRAVREGRGSRLKETPEIFSGLVWTGQTSITLGLTDGLGTVESVARDIVKVEDILDYTQHEGWVERVLRRFSVSVGEGIGHVVLGSMVNTARQLR
ncbi:MAG: S49 family peptidase [Ottowia sp.]|nr:S49 family peptidase [Ottowia sp.]